MSFATQSAVLQSLGQPLQVVSSSISLPLRSGSAVVKILCAEVAQSWKRIFSGNFPLKPPVPFTPGSSGVGVVEAVADDVFGVKVNDLVIMDSLHTTASGNRLLIGFCSLGNLADPDDAKQVQLYKNGTWTTRALLPASSLYVVSPAFLQRNPATTIEQLMRVRNLCVSHGAILASEFQSGDRVLVNGASGRFGGWVVLLLLLLNAGRVYVMGRNEKALKGLVELEPQRVQAVVVQMNASVPSEEKKDEQSNGNDSTKIMSVVDQVKNQLGSDWQCIDRFIDFLGPTTETSSVGTGIQSLRVGGFASLAGGVFSSIPISYTLLLSRQLTVRGSFMSPRSSFEIITSLLPRMFERFGNLFQQTDFDGVEYVNTALDTTVEGTFHSTVIYPNSKASAQQEMKQRTQ